MARLGASYIDLYFLAVKQLGSFTLRQETESDEPVRDLAHSFVELLNDQSRARADHTDRMRHPERGLLHALVIASVGFVLVPCVSSAVLILWVRTGGDSIQAAFVSIFVFLFGFWGFRRWLRSAPRAARPAKALVAPVAHAAPRSGLAGEVAELRAEVARLRAERQDRGGEDVAEMSRRPIH